MNYTTERLARLVTDTVITENIETRRGYVVGATRYKVVTSHTDGNTTGERGREETGTSTCTIREVGRKTTAMNRGRGRVTT